MDVVSQADVSMVGRIPLLKNIRQVASSFSTFHRGGITGVIVLEKRRRDQGLFHIIRSDP